MKMDVLLGLQWGDEGKGKVVDVLAPKYHTVARFQGGPNAGHTLEFDGNKHVLHQIPSGIFRSTIKNVIGNGVVLDPVIFKKEIEKLDPFNINFKESLWISNKAQLILPTHRLLDAAYEKSKGNKKIGSTLKGIGPTYQDKVARLGLRVGDIFYPSFPEKYKKLVDIHKMTLDFYQYDYAELEEAEKTFFEALEYLKTFNVSSTEYLINKELKEGKSVLAEGAQGSLLDVDFGSYPFVTSSNTMTAGVCTGLGVAPNSIQKVYGIFKAYCTRVGGGPFPTELFDEDGKELQKVGNEFGATTGRPRRCGWLDIPALKYVVMINGVTELFMMKADVLSGFEKIKVCTQYELEDGTKTEEFPYDIVDSEVKPIYEELDGWNCSLDKINSFDDMPQALTNYITYIEDKIGVPINLVSVGPDRTQTILR
ncbi:adenylosuccinate synthase [Marivirga harenae]|uniref:adenylosuccinate synthase n=1 Tax=Marivirga harenae TaxID=2010992 RepID=UPI0026DF3B89|nr:adenylosuccinate synthase [Marivirga harenae]WKV12080.1 adenylosuccinate synthase [Marivirga harenae]|tara:strand:+ start:189952 stop:191223 length:1272 start_codon:yes stop_codon:yes gene_type:complete